MFRKLFSFSSLFLFLFFISLFYFFSFFLNIILLKFSGCYLAASPKALYIYHGGGGIFGGTTVSIYDLFSPDLPNNGTSSFSFDDFSDTDNIYYSSVSGMLYLASYNMHDNACQVK